MAKLHRLKHAATFYHLFKRFDYNKPHGHKTRQNEKQQTPKSLDCNIYTMYNKIKALSKHTGSKKLMIRETKSIMIIMLKLNGAI